MTAVLKVSEGLLIIKQIKFEDTYVKQTILIEDDVIRVLVSEQDLIIFTTKQTLLYDSNLNLLYEIGNEKLNVYVDE